jgi:hypothetical protein
MSRESLVEAYVSALPFAAVAIVQTAGGGCRIETAAPGAPGEAIYYFKPSHVDLVLGAAGLAAGPIDATPAAVAALIEKTALAMGAPFKTSAEIRAAAKIQVAEIVAKVEAARQAGGMKQTNRQYKAYRQAQLAKGRKGDAVPQVSAALHGLDGARCGGDWADDLEAGDRRRLTPVYGLEYGFKAKCQKLCN